jgi:hypothetical protein
VSQQNTTQKKPEGHPFPLPERRVQIQAHQIARDSHISEIHVSDPLLGKVNIPYQSVQANPLSWTFVRLTFRPTASNTTSGRSGLL